MALKPSSPSKQNQMIGQWLNKADPDKGHASSPEKPRVKRLKIEDTRSVSDSRQSSPDHEPRLDHEGEVKPDDENDQRHGRGTILEAALAPISTDQEAIDEYESSQAARHAENVAANISDRFNKRQWVRGKSSIYVDAFNLALETVLEEESHLFDEAEKALFGSWRELTYDAQYLYVRLFLRKTSAWHRVSGLGYHSDVANMEESIAELQVQRDLPAPSKLNLSQHPGELEPPPGTTLDDTFTFADNSELITTLEEASSLLRLDELKSLAKEAKVNGKNKKDLISGLRRTSKQQSGLRSVLRRSETQESTGSTDIESPPAFDDPDKNLDGHFLRKILDETGSCIRLTLAPLKLFERVHLVFYRSTEWTEKSLTTIILARVSRRNFPQYIVSRSASIFPSRELLVEYEAALRTQFRVDNILEFGGWKDGPGFEEVIRICDEVYPRWCALVRDEQRKEDSIYHSGEGAYLRRLSPAWVYTRIIHKATAVYGRLKEHMKEHGLLTELLEQKLFHHARRGAWYQRKALLEEHYIGLLTDADGRGEEAQKRHWRRISLATCEDGLQDPLVHLIYHHDLQKRISKLERACRIPKREQHDFSHVRLAAPVEVTIEGVRIYQEIDEMDAKQSLRGSKTIWLDPLEGDGECSVENMCLSNYRMQGWKGFHSEGRIVRTLFAYLFLDIMFSYVPNVFQTEFQACPLDLHTDAFYPSRLSDINHRLMEIGNGAAADIIRRVWDEHSERETCVVGLDWAYDVNDLMEIVDYMDGEALATICKVMAQDYGTRGGGMPDLFLWHTEKKEVKFAEVKSENDRLSDTQRLWIDVLTGAGVRVELCNAVSKKTQS